MIKNLPAMQETQVQSLRWEDPVEKQMATHSTILARRIPWTEEPCTLHSMGLKELDITKQLTLSLSLIHICTLTFLFSSIVVYHRILNIFPCAIQ